jgi:hypothetical protein
MGNCFCLKLNGKFVFDGISGILGISTVSEFAASITFASIMCVYIRVTVSLVPLHSPLNGIRFLRSMIMAPNLSFSS